MDIISWDNEAEIVILQLVGPGQDKGPTKEAPPILPSAIRDPYTKTTYRIGRLLGKVPTYQTPVGLTEENGKC